MNRSTLEQNKETFCSINFSEFKNTSEVCDNRKCTSWYLQTAFSRSYAVWSAIGTIPSSVCLSVCTSLKVYDDVYLGARSRCRWNLKVIRHVLWRRLPSHFFGQQLSFLWHFSPGKICFIRSCLLVYYFCLSVVLLRKLFIVVLISTVNDYI